MTPLKKKLLELKDSIFVVSCVVIFGLCIVILAHIFSVTYFNSDDPDIMNIFVTAILSSSITMYGLHQMIEHKKERREREQD